MSRVCAASQERTPIEINVVRTSFDNIHYRMIESELSSGALHGSPLHLLTMDDAEMLKNVVLHSVATALASIVWGRDGWRE